MDLEQFARAMATAGAELEIVLHKGVVEACKLLQTTAKEAIGTYEFGWPALKPETVARKANGDTPLLETGELQSSIEYNVDWLEGCIGTNDYKAAWQEFGTSRGIPPRPFLGGAVVKEGEHAAELCGKQAMTVFKS